ncbi:MAG: hypothetical protein AAF748_02255 [Pseudomonadota bacterium]
MRILVNTLAITALLASGWETEAFAKGKSASKPTTVSTAPVKGGTRSVSGLDLGSSR